MKLTEKLVKYGVIEDAFDYLELEEELIEKYTYFENKLNTLYEDYANAFKLKDCLFYIKSDIQCNAFARCRKGYNIIGITCAYVMCMDKLFDRDYFNQVILLALKNNIATSEAYCYLLQKPEFNFNQFILDCSITFTFGHEFRHILQNNTEDMMADFYFSENIDSSTYSEKKHIWEFDADRYASYQVIKHIFQVKNEINIKSDEEIKCLLYVGMSSIIITKLLFYFGLKNAKTPTEIEKIPLYTKEKSHPHPFARIVYIFDFYFENLKSILPKTPVEKQDLLNNSLVISKIYLDSIIDKNNLIEIFLNDLDDLNLINNYNSELYDSALMDKTVRFLWDTRGSHVYGN